ncbi:hypothetical protein MSG28_011392 [Choristoneura fumiferana]|uniref:Uncharacterized protein n=1 Tax=Choristoneura fumiferana TaxID=7141 RepID=A0ACC0JNA2_CHOFU|nr:hypothetical protein MSG28_011392 [Choristoneura fumiferana]
MRKPAQSAKQLNGVCEGPNPHWPAWELRPNPSHPERRPVPSSGTYIGLDKWMNLPPPLFQELENVELMLMTKRDRVGRNFSYTLGDPDQTIVYTIVEEELSPLHCVAKGTGSAYAALAQKLPALVCSPVENVIGHLRRLSGYLILDENKEKIFNITKNEDSLFGPVPMSVQRVSNKELVAQIGRRWMMEPLGEIRPTPLQRWGTRFLVPMPLKEKVLILTMTLIVDYIELSIDPSGHNSMLPPTLFQELENVELMLMTKEDRVGRNFSYTLGTLTRPSCIPSLRRSSGVSRVDPRFPMKFKMMYEGDEVMKLDRIPTQGTWYTRCICLCPYTDNFRVCSPAENVIGYVERLPYWFEWIRGLPCLVPLDEYPLSVITVS